MIPVHLFGATVDLDPILAITREAGIHVIEDACQAHGARYRGRRTGTHRCAWVASASTRPRTWARWGDGGAIVTAVPELDERIRLLRAHGERPRYHHRVVGTTARLDALQAAVLRRKLTRLDDWNEARRRLGAELRSRLGGLADAPAGEAIELVELPFAAGRSRLPPVRRAQRQPRCAAYPSGSSRVLPRRFTIPRRSIAPKRMRTSA